MTRIRPRSGQETISRLDREGWEAGDYVLAEVVEDPRGRAIEDVTGRMVEISEGDQLVGALGSRFATLEATGSWEDVGTDGMMHVLSGGGLLGRCRTISTLLPGLVPIRYVGHLFDGGRKQTMSGCVRDISQPEPFDTPVVLLTGTSMSAGKTSAARIVIRRLKRRGLSVLGAKLAGAGRYRDILAMEDAGADAILDFVDVGLPSTHCDTELYEERLRTLLAAIARERADVAVIEIGASPLEPYNGETAIASIRPQVRVNILCASDPYAVVGALAAYDLAPDLVTGITSNTEAGVQLVERLTGLRAVDVRKPASFPELDRTLEAGLGLGPVPES